MGPGILIKALLQGSFSLMVFGWTQIVMDVQPLIGILSGASELHGFTHTYVGATLLAVFAALSGKYLSEWALKWLLPAPTHHAPIRWWVAGVSAAIGSYSHVAIDSLMHADMKPFAPFADSNSLLGVISVATLHRLCVYSGVAGGVLYFTIHYLVARRNKS